MSREDDPAMDVAVVLRITLKACREAAPSFGNIKLKKRRISPILFVWVEDTILGDS